MKKICNISSDAPVKILPLGGLTYCESFDFASSLWSNARSQNKLKTRTLYDKN